MSTPGKLRIMDPLYGVVEFSKEISSLIWRPPVQRLRHIRLSNIDSLEMPGIANISRYEHSLGVCFLATKVGFSYKLDAEQSLVLQAAALLHDWTITPYGHLVEEAYLYVEHEHDHESKMKKLRTFIGSELGGVNLQLLYGRETKMDQWATETFGNNWEKCLADIANMALGEGPLGKSTSGSVDLDNIDNLTRIAFHMGLDVDRALPQQIASGMIDCNSEEGVTFSPEALTPLKNWLDLRKIVYSHLMPSRMDFCGKAMLIQATVWALESGQINQSDWILTDHDLINLFLSSKVKKINQAIQRWLAGELWELSNLLWMNDSAPDYKKVLEFSRVASQELKRDCFAYRIKDKRTRELKISITDGRELKLGASSTKWLLGVVSSKSQSFTSKENDKLTSLACDFFQTTCIGHPEEYQANTMELPF